MREKKKIEITTNCKNKTSTGWNDIDGTIVKNVMSELPKPLTHICNLSFQKDTFQYKMKIAKVIPLFKIDTITNH